MKMISIMARTNLSIEEAVFDDFSAQAGKRNMTLFAFANDSLSTISKIVSEGGDPTEVYAIWKILTILREVDVITLPSDFVERLIERQCAADKERLLQDFRDLGASIVGLLKMEADDIAGLTRLAKDFSFITPIKHFAVSNGQNGNIQVDVVGAGKRIETTECSSEFLKTILNEYGYSITKVELHPGAIRIWAQRRNQERKEAYTTAEAW